jgi:ORF6N domain
MTKRLNEAVSRNRKRFPEDFIFQLTDLLVPAAPKRGARFLKGGKTELNKTGY